MESVVTSASGKGKVPELAKEKAPEKASMLVKE